MDAGERLLKAYKEYIGSYEPDDVLRFRTRDLRQGAELKVGIKNNIVVVLEKIDDGRYKAVGERPGYSRPEDRFITLEIDGRDWEKAG